MRALMGLIKDRHGTYYAQRKVPERLQEAVARVLNSDKSKQVFLKKSLGTKVLRQANVAATHVLAGFDRTLAGAEALLKERPVVSSLTDAQIKRMAETYYASVLANDEEERQEGTGTEPIFQSVAQQLAAAGVDFKTPFKVGEVPEAGLSDREVFKREHTLAENLPDAMAALAKGDTTHVRLDVDELLEAFQINLDHKSQSYRRLGMAVLGARVRALKDIARRNAEEPIETPVFSMGAIAAPAVGGTLSSAVEGWEKERARPPGCQSEQDDKWNFCLTTAIIAVHRRNHEQTTPPEPLTGLQGEGGSGRRQGRPHNRPAGGAFRRSPQSDHGMEITA